MRVFDAYGNPIAADDDAEQPARVHNGDRFVSIDPHATRAQGITRVAREADPWTPAPGTSQRAAERARGPVEVSERDAFDDR